MYKENLTQLRPMAATQSIEVFLLQQCCPGNSFACTNAQQHGGRVATGDRDKGNFRRKKKRFFSAPSHGAPQSELVTFSHVY